MCSLYIIPGEFKIDLVIIDCPAKWGMIFSRKWAESVEEFPNVTSFSTIPIEGSLVGLYGEKKNVTSN